MAKEKRLILPGAWARLAAAEWSFAKQPNRKFLNVFANPKKPRLEKEQAQGSAVRPGVW
ncbi:MAG: hypothetical protein WAL41_31855 [Mycobacterium sp.]